MPTRRARLDTELVRRGLVSSRTEAQRLIAEGRVTVGGGPAWKPSTLVAAADDLALTPGDSPYVSRGGEKLAAALDAFDLSVAGRVCLDAGASTGGFTDVLLRRGAAQVTAVDVGYGQLAWPLRTDERVVVLDRTNVRYLEPGDVPSPPPDLVTADLSFISLTRVLAPLVAVAAEGADYVLLVKPQFEAGPEAVGRGGVVRDPQVWRRALLQVAAAAATAGLGCGGAVPSHPLGPSGNVEFFLRLRAGPGLDPARLADGAVTAGEQLRRLHDERR